jgi:Poly (ADP-ribose) glycohydrolase (PARG)
MHSVSLSRSERFKKLWGLSAAPEEASEAWGELRILNMTHGHLILSHEFPHKASRYVLERCLRVMGRAWAPKNSALDSILDWLAKYALEIHPDWKTSMSHSPMPSHFGRLLEKFFVNLRSIYSEGRSKEDLPEEFWPWFTGVLHMITRKHDTSSKTVEPVPTLFVPPPSKSTVPSAPIPFFAPTLTPAIATHALTHIIPSAPKPFSPTPPASPKAPLAPAHHAHHGAFPKHGGKEVRMQISQFSDIDQFKTKMLTGNGININSLVLDHAIEILNRIDGGLPRVLKSINNLAVNHYEDIRRIDVHKLGKTKTIRNANVKYTRQECSGMIFGILMGSFSGVKGAYGEAVTIRTLLMVRDPSRIEVNANKLACFLSYWVSFSELAQSNFSSYTAMMKKELTFEMRSALQATSAEKLLEKHADDLLIDVRFERGDMSEDTVGNLFVDFANMNIGGGVLKSGAVQEEIEFCRRPECLVSILLFLRMNADDVIYICDTVATSKTVGYGHGKPPFKFSRPMSSIDLEEQSHKTHDIVAIDATSFKQYPKLNTVELLKRYYSCEHIRRDFFKCYLAALGPESLRGKALHIVTGKWGGGDFSGTDDASTREDLLKVKQAIQIAAVTAAYRDRRQISGTNRLTYYDKDRLGQIKDLSIKKLFDKILQKTC